ncbi:hypothetical protein LZ575_17640 [Antarcticibacterium sp. 1MA-6-2]|uniref:hypothetical protein n=1 Tax=Antarcticibacterium sp. 1MA-6-2 TaxID=2908210 RepID=UPI001F41B7B5|nr:hypothetical protein [Antarcticibacterium sp. 1MA-6-2]UJH90587.1 hypothetical protein LZ575_17640 [Antarcticibacterium sp. 1MA-6-2]
MKKLFLILCVAALSTSATVYVPFTVQDVFICDSKGGKKYHFNKNCRGLSACKAQIKKLTLTDAKKLGKDICGWED